MSEPTSSSTMQQARARGNRRRHHPRSRPEPTRNTDSSPSTDFVHSEQIQQFRRGGSRGRITGDSSLAMRPASVVPSKSQQRSSPTDGLDGVSTGEQRATRRGMRGRGRVGRTNMPGRTRQGSEQTPMSSGALQGRQFGGHLTADDSVITSGESRSARLQGGAAEFVPGRKNAPLSENLANGNMQRQRRYSKSSAPDIATRTHEDIEHGVYECPICTNEILRSSKIWSCRTCWTVFHLHCIKTWAEKGASKEEMGADGTEPSRQNWRCPGCNLPKHTRPGAYHCWCGKEETPRTITGFPPHSCGQTCGSERVLPKHCPHPCDLICHAGPCPPCNRMGPTRSCYCGKNVITRRCLDTDYGNGWSCEEVCGDSMPCGEHICPRKCHEGLCGACEVPIEARCYCGQTEKLILCCDRDEDKISKCNYVGKDGQRITEEWIGKIDCGNRCSRPFDCGKHSCEKACHPQTADDEHCPRSPDVVTSCPCGKTNLDELVSEPRQTCEDSIPQCTKSCGKPLPCGHPCTQTCHLGECIPCLKRIPINCRCGRTSSTTLCHQGTIEQPQCMRICNATLNCGRHTCDEHCCPGERTASERQSAFRNSRKLRRDPRSLDIELEAEHICKRICGRPLKCGNHTCQDLCHKGPCPSCREAIFDEISCGCGRTALQPPLPCGTPPPPCPYTCERPKSCGHPQIPHSCHQDSEACPKCPFLTSKVCLCGKKTLKNQQCWRPSVRCGEICGKTLKCGSHACRKTCHAPGECEDADTNSRTCQQACSKPKKACGHPCEETCHAPFPCREEKSCSHKIFITCPCQTQKVEARCNASKHDLEGNAKKELKCDDECARLERNRKLALALNIDQSTHTDDHVPYSAGTLRMYQELGSQWAQQQEREFRVFSEASDEKRLRFKPMPSTQRAFLHGLAEDFGLDSESLDPELHRHVVLYKTPRFVSAPNKTVGECVRIRVKQQRFGGIGTPPNEEIPKKEVRSNLLGEPYNGFLLTNPRFGLTIDELRSVVESAAADGTMHHLEISFLPSGEVVLKPRHDGVPQGRTIAAEREGEAALKNVKPTIASAISSNGMGSLQLCRSDNSLNVIRSEADEAPTGGAGGWNQVAAKGAPRKEVKPTAPFQDRNGFGVLGQNKMVVFGKKKEKQNKETLEVVDDWEKAMSEEEDREKEMSKMAKDEESEAEVELQGAPGESEERTVVDPSSSGISGRTALAEA